MKESAKKENRENYRVLRSAAHYERRSERRSQKSERERDRRSKKNWRARARAPLIKSASASIERRS